MKNNPPDRFAGFWRRVGAFALDYMIILLYLAMMTMSYFLVSSVSDIAHWLFAERIRAQLAGFLLVTLPISLYFALGESSIRRATWGKQRLGLKVVDLTGSRIRFWRAFARTALKFIPWEISHSLIWEISFKTDSVPAWVNYGFVLVYTLIGLNIASFGFSKTKQTLYDFLTGTCVIG